MFHGQSRHGFGEHGSVYVQRQCQMRATFGIEKYLRAHGKLHRHQQEGRGIGPERRIAGCHRFAPPKNDYHARTVEDMQGMDRLGDAIEAETGHRRYFPGVGRVALHGLAHGFKQDVHGLSMDLPGGKDEQGDDLSGRIVQNTGSIPIVAGTFRGHSLQAPAPTAGPPLKRKSR